MKRIIKSTLVLTLCLISLFNVHAFALEKNDIEVQDIFLSQDEINEILAKGNTYTAPERATGLILDGAFGINNDYKLLQFVAFMDCGTEVVRCGFEDIIVQRRASSSDSWSFYYQFDDDIVDSCTHLTIKAVTTVKGYEYRVICTLYAKKNFFSVQRIFVETNIIAW
ncbi:MAG: hypothetical protein IKL47_03805 [Clostridia bacterium]|nr:hypothetical protein [Clostridia bacterium]